MIVLGIETSCDETAVALVRGREVLSNAVASQHDLHAEFGGVVPEIASRAHAERILPMLRQALDGHVLASIDAIAVAHRPGLIGSLVVGVSAAKALAWSLGVPLVGVDHVRAHLLAPMLVNPGEHAKDPGFPAIGLVVSGGHTSVYEMRSPSELTRLGATIDDAIGEAFDKVASILGIPHPGGPNLEKIARAGDENAFDFPISLLARGSLDFSFSGLKTAVLYEAKGRPAPRPIPGKPPRQAPPPPTMTDQRRADIAASFQRAAIRAITKKIARAIEHHPRSRSLVVGGGVSANLPLRAALERLAKRHRIDLRLASPAYCGDNAAMIAGLGAELLASHAAQDLGLHLEAVPTTSA